MKFAGRVASRARALPTVARAATSGEAALFPKNMLSRGTRSARLDLRKSWIERAEVIFIKPKAP